MQLNKLTVFKNGTLLREVTFRKGLNLIVNSASSVGEKTGNSVGKSTLSRLLDYLFMSSGKDIYTEPEFKKVIPEVFSFIKDNLVTIQLEFLGHSKKTLSITRVLNVEPNESKFYIDQTEVDEEKYTDLVAREVFGLISNKPSIRTVSNKFIRNTNEKMQNTTKFLFKMAKPDLYDQLYLFLFGFSGLNLLSQKAELANKIKTKNKYLSAYRVPHKESVLKKLIKPLQAEELELQNKIDNFDLREGQEASVQELVNIQSEISDLTIEYSTVRSRIDYLDRSISNLRSSSAKVDGRELEEIYADAGISVSSGLKRSFEELVIFHNKVLSNKVDLIQSEVDKKKIITENLRGALDKLNFKEGEVFRHIKEPDTLKSIGQIYNSLSEIKEQIASVKASLDKIENTKLEIANLLKEKTTIVTKIEENTEELSSNVELFNKFFNELSKKFYDDRFIFDLEFDVEKEKCTFDIASVSPNSTGGMKKGELSAFDFAYIKFINELNLKRPSFIIHDSIEDVDVNQVFDIFQEANKLDGQYIVALLRDKIATPQFNNMLKDTVILELSETNKFFKI